MQRCLGRRLCACVVLPLALASLADAGQTVAAPSSRVTSSATLIYSRFLPHPTDRVNSVAAGPDGTLYLTGVTLIRTSTVDVTKRSAGEGKPFVARISSDGSSVLYFTYLGQNCLDEARAIAVDPLGNAYVTGEARAKDFPALHALQSKCNLDGAGECRGNAFLVKLNPQGSLMFSTYLGGSGEDSGNAIALDPRGNIYIAGTTTSVDFPTVNAWQSAPGGEQDAFVAKIAGDGSHVLYATYLGGTARDEAYGIAVDRTGNAYVTGETVSMDFPTNNAVQEKCAEVQSTCPGEAFITKLSADGSAVLYSTYLGGSGGDSAFGIAVDSAGNAYVAGATKSIDFPAVRPVQSSLAGPADAFVTEISRDGKKLLFSTYLGGNGSEQARAIALDSAGKVFVSGWTGSPDFPTRNPVQAFCRSGSKGCSVDAFVAALDAKASKLEFSTYLGGSGIDVSRGIAVDAQGLAYVGGWTTSSDFPQVMSAQSDVDQVTNNSAVGSSGTKPISGGSFVARLDGLLLPPSTVTCKSGTNSWTGTAGNNQWTTSSNWSLNRVPIASDSVCIASTFSGSTIVISSLAAPNQTISQLTSGAPISFSDGPLTISGPTNLIADLNISSGLLSFGGSGSVSTLELSGGTLSGAGGITASGLVTWSGGQMCTDYSLQNQTCSQPSKRSATTANAGLTISGSVTLDGRALNNAQTATLTGAYTLTLLDGATIHNLTGAIWNLAADANINTSGSGTVPVFDNEGTFDKTGGTGTSTIQPIFNNTGTTEVNAATVDFTGGGTCGTACPGSWTVASGATLQFGQGEYQLSGQVGGAGAAGAGTVSFSNGAVTLTGNYNISGATSVTTATVNFNGTVTNTGAITVSGGLANFATTSVVTLTVPSMTLSGGTLSAQDNFVITGLLTWSGGNMCTNYSSGTCSAPTTQAATTAEGGIQFGAGTAVLDGRTLNNNKTATMTVGNFSYFNLLNSAIVNNNAGAIWNLAADANLDGFSGTFNNLGIFVKTDGTSTSIVEPVFNNTGTVAANAAILDLIGGGSCGGTCGGSWSAGSGATLQFDTGTFSLSGKISGPGTLNFSSGTETLTGTYSVTGTTNFSGALVDFNQSGSVTFSGPVNLANGYVYGPATLNFSGLVTWTYGVLCTVYSSASSSCVAPQTQAITNATGGIAMPSGYPTLDGRTLNNSQTMSMTGSGYYLNLLDGAVINNTVRATWNLAADAGLNGSSGTFNNLGTFEKTAGTGTSTVQVIFNNTGKVMANAALLDLTGGGICSASCAGSWSVASGATLQFDSGTFVLSGAISGAGTVDFGSGAETLTGTYTLTGTSTFSGGVVAFNQSSAVTLAGPVSFTAGFLYGTATLNFNAPVTWTYASLCTAYSFSTSSCTAPATQALTNASGGITLGEGNATLDGRTLNNKQTVTMTSRGNYINLLDSAIVNNNAGATWNLLADADINGASGTFNNSGTFEKTGGSGTSAVQAGFVNSGSVQANSGTLNFATLFSQTSGNTFLGGGILSLSSPATFSGGTLSGSGTIGGSVVNSSATVAPGTSTVTGTITFASSSSDYTQDAAATYSVKIGGTGTGQYDQISVGGLTTLAGALKVTLINGFSPSKGSTYTIIRSGSLQGQFSGVPEGWNVTYNKTSVVLTFQ